MNAIDYKKYEGHKQALTVITHRDICDDAESIIPELGICVTDWSDAELALHIDAPLLLAGCQERDARIKAKVDEIYVQTAEIVVLEAKVKELESLLSRALPRITCAICPPEAGKCHPCGDSKLAEEIKAAFEGGEVRC